MSVIQNEPAWTLAGGPALDLFSSNPAMAWGDYDNDGDLDIYKACWNTPNILFRNDSGVFVDATTAPIDDAGGGQGAAWGDYDNDGDLDIYLANNGANKLFRNNGGGSFSDVTSGPLGDAAYGQSVSWVDYDNDGMIDIFVTNLAGLNRLLRNLGGGIFNDVTAGNMTGTLDSRGAAWADYDLDGDMDLYVTNDFGEPNRLYRNDAGVFTNVTTPVLAGSSRSWGAAWGDYDNDGDPDLYIANVESDNRLLRNDGAGDFVPVTLGPLAGTINFSSNPAWGDYDLDGDLDLYVLNSGVPNQLLRNDGAGVFTDIFGRPVADPGGSRGGGWGDYDNDGDLDLYVVNSGEDLLIRNDQATGHYWLHVNLEGSVSNRYGVGARISVKAGGVVQTRNVPAGSGHASQNSLTVEFGLGLSAIVDVVEVQWPSGIIDRLRDVPANQVITMNEGVSWVDRTTAITAGGPVTSEGIAWGDYDADGDLDFFVANRDISNVLLRNNGNGGFADATTAVVGGTDGSDIRCYVGRLRQRRRH